MKTNDYDIIVVGGGLVGLAFALDIANKKPRFEIAIIDAKPPVKIAQDTLDSRVYAISPHNVSYLEKIGAWPNQLSRMGVIDKMDVYGDGDSCIVFDKRDYNQFFLAKTIESNILQENMLLALADLENISFIYDKLNTVEYIANNRVRLCGHSCEYTCSLIIGADGANSFIRNQLDFEINQVNYNSYGIVANFRCELPHNNIARQWFSGDDILAYLPLPDNQISIVWAHSNYEELMKIDILEFENLVATAGFNTLGKLKLITPREAFPLKMNLINKTYTKNVVLIGDAAHTIHPLAGQGVNLGFSDASVLVDTLCAVEKYQIADTVTLDTYNRKRMLAVKKMQLTCHGLNRLFAIKNPVIKRLRNLGLNIVNKLPLAKKFLVKNAV